MEWKDPEGLQKEGVFIPRRDTDALVNRLAGGRLFPGEHNTARLSVSERKRKIDFSMESVDGKIFFKVVGEETDTLPSASPCEWRREIFEDFLRRLTELR